MDKLEETRLKIEKIKKELRETPYHKATQHHIGRLRQRLSKLEEKQISQQSKKGAGLRFNVKKQGDATVILIGFPSVGKSTLLNALTQAHAKVADYVFTTVTAIPGMMEYNSARIQLVDVPGLISGSGSGKGHGLAILSLVRNADLVLIIIEAGKLWQLEQIKKELVTAQIVLKNYLVVVNKRDLVDSGQARMTNNELIFISAQEKKGLEELKKAIWQKLNLMRIYLGPEKRKKDMEPLIMKAGQTVKDVAEAVHQEIADKILNAKVSGRSAKFPGQIVSLSHQLVDGDMVSF